MKHLLLSFLIFILFANYGSSQNITVKRDTIYNIGSKVEYFVDKSSSFTIDSITAPSAQINFTPQNPYSSFLSDFKGTIWVRFQLVNLLKKDLYVIFENPPLKSATLFYRTNSNSKNWLTANTGYFFPNENYNLLNFYSLPLPYTTDVGYYYIKVEEPKMPLPMCISSLSNLARHNLKFNALIYIQLGILCSIVLFNLILFYFLREKIFLLFISFILSTLYIFFFYGGGITLLSNVPIFIFQIEHAVQILYLLHYLAFCSILLDIKLKKFSMTRNAFLFLFSTLIGSLITSFFVRANSAHYIQHSTYGSSLLIWQSCNQYD